MPPGPSMYLLFNHSLTSDQEQDATTNHDVRTFVALPSPLQPLLSQVPPQAELNLQQYLQPLLQWLTGEVKPNDLLLIQGEPGVSFLLTTWAFQQGAIPLYATTERHAIEEKLPDGSIAVRHQFRHVAFRQYPRPPSN